jgi:hypothetical protein
MQLLREMNMTRAMVCMLFGIFPAVMPSLAAAQAKRHPLESAEGLRLHDVTAQPVTYKGKKGLRIVADTARLRERAAAPGQPAAPLLALVDGVDFSSGVIEVELAGEPAPGAGAGARGFVGVAFRVQPVTLGRASSEARKLWVLPDESRPTGRTFSGPDRHAGRPAALTRLPCAGRSYILL